MAASVHTMRCFLAFIPLLGHSVEPGSGHTSVHHEAKGTWTPTRCGSAASPHAHIPTAYANAVHPTSVKTTFGYPRPTMTRKLWHSLNGLWEFQQTTEGAKPLFNTTLNQTILVPFPVEACLSGLKNASIASDDVAPSYPHMLYRTMFNGSFVREETDGGDVLLHFGAIDWQSTVYVNGLWVGSHEGGYDSFTLSIGHALGNSGFDEILVSVYDPSSWGQQPAGKQRVDSMWRPWGDTYSPTSGIWQPVWLEPVPAKHISNLKVNADTKQLNINVLTNVPDGSKVTVEITSHGNIVASGTGISNMPFSIAIQQPHLWSPEDPFLYNMTVSCGQDKVGSYFGMREVSLCADPTNATVSRPCINMKYRFLAGVLDQSWWPEGQYTAPGDEALIADLMSVKSFGMNFVRLHQKVNPERYYYHADRMGIVIAQDMPQHYGNGNNGPGWVTENGHDRARFYWSDLKAMISGKANHPCIIQWTVFNERDMVEDFDVSSAVNWVRFYDPTRLIDADSATYAGAGLGDVHDHHAGAPNPGNPESTPTQIAMDGEWGNLEYFIDGHTWSDVRDIHLHNDTWTCNLYTWTPDTGLRPGDLDPHGNASGAAKAFVNTLVDMTGKFYNYTWVSMAAYVMLADIEGECDGLLSYDRTAKMLPRDREKLRKAFVSLSENVTKCLPRTNRPTPVPFPQWMHNAPSAGITALVV